MFLRRLHFYSSVRAFIFSRNIGELSVLDKNIDQVLQTLQTIPANYKWSTYESFAISRRLEVGLKENYSETSQFLLSNNSKIIIDKQLKISLLYHAIQQFHSWTMSSPTWFLQDNQAKFHSALFRKLSYTITSETLQDFFHTINTLYTHGYRLQPRPNSAVAWKHLASISFAPSHKLFLLYMFYHEGVIESSSWTPLIESLDVSLLSKAEKEVALELLIWLEAKKNNETLKTDPSFADKIQKMRQLLQRPVKGAVNELMGVRISFLDEPLPNVALSLCHLKKAQSKEFLAQIKAELHMEKERWEEAFKISGLPKDTTNVTCGQYAVRHSTEVEEGYRIAFDIDVKHVLQQVYVRYLSGINNEKTKGEGMEEVKPSLGRWNYSYNQLNKYYLQDGYSRVRCMSLLSGGYQCVVNLSDDFVRLMLQVESNEITTQQRGVALRSFYEQKCHDLSEMKVAQKELEQYI